MTKQEENIWFLLIGILSGMLIDFVLVPDIYFYQTKWLVVLVALMVWTVWRDWIGGKHER